MSVLDDSYENFVSQGSRLPVDYEDRSKLDDDNHLPSWFNQRKFGQVKNLSSKYFFSLCFCHLSGLLILVFIRSIFTTLSRTGKSKNRVTLFHRYHGTLVHVKKWYEGKLWNKNDEAYLSLLKVKKMHQNVSDNHNKDKMMAKDQMSISQRDMTLTQFAFLGLAILCPDKIGFSTRKEDAETLIHFWAVVGYMLGIPDEYNLCLGDYDQVKQRCQKIFEKDFKPNLIKPDEESIKMSRQILEAINQI